MTTYHDWDLLSHEGVQEAVEGAAFRVARRLNLDADDLLQEALILATNLDTNLPECIHAGQLGLLCHRLEQDLSNLSGRQLSARGRNESFEQRYEDEWAQAAPLPQRTDRGGYTRELVESLLPAVWDEWYCMASRSENSPDPDMPRGSMNKATGNTVAAHIADIRAAWESTSLTRQERQALFLTVGLDWTQQSAARSLGVSQKSVSNWVYSGVGRLLAALNGDEALLEQIEGAAA